MAENENGQEKTEAPSARRRGEARSKGNVARSAEINSAAIILAGTGFLYVAGGKLLQGIMRIFTTYLKNITTTELVPENMRPLFLTNAVSILYLVGPFLLVIIVIGVAVNLAQVGFLWSSEALTPKFEKLKIISGLKRLFSLRSVVDLLKNIFKLVIISLVIYFTITARIDTFFRLMDESVGNILIFLAGISGEVMFKVAIAMLVLALSDYVYQRWEYEKNLKMTKEEVREENKMTEGNPQIKARIREIQRATARRRMMAKVPEADVVITNPTHYAVALQYDPARSSAPVVVAKGERKVALRIREIAEKHNVPIVEDPPLARLLFSQAEIGREIPVETFQAVAEILSYVYRLQKRKFDLN